jgi:putative endonuclease
MPFTVYILYSVALDQYYTGQTQNLKDRLFRHNNSGSKSTKKVNDWKLVYSEVFETRAEAVRRESEIKKKKSRRHIEWLIGSAG